VGWTSHATLSQIDTPVGSEVLNDEDLLSPEEEEMWAASEAAVTRGELLTHKEVLERRAARRAQGLTPRRENVIARTDLYALIDALPEESLPAVARYLETVGAGAPPDAPEDDEPLAPETEAMIAESRADYERGAWSTSAELRAQFGLPNDE
jgi:hypothetical protein